MSDSSLHRPPSADDPAAALNGWAAGWSAGWDSGPSATIEPVPASQVRAGDVLVLDDAGFVSVTDTRRGTFWLNTGRHEPGVAVGWRSRTGSASGIAFRAETDLVQRVAP